MAPIPEIAGMATKNNHPTRGDKTKNAQPREATKTKGTKVPMMMAIVFASLKAKQALQSLRGILVM